MKPSLPARRVAVGAALALLAPLPLAGAAVAAGSPSIPVVCSSVNQEVARNQPVTVALQCTDLDGDPVDRYEISSPPSKAAQFSLDAGTGVVTYRSTQEALGTDSFSFRGVVDGLGQSTPTQAVLTLRNERPTCAATGPVSVVHDRAALVPVSCADADGDALTLTIGTTGASHGRVTVQGPSGVTYTPAARYTGTDQFSVVAADGDKTSAEVDVQVRVTNKRPTCGGRSVKVRHDRATRISLRCEDGDGDRLTRTVVAQPQNGTVTWKGGSFDYRPARGYLGRDQFTVGATDGVRASRPATVSVRVANRAPSCKGRNRLVVKRGQTTRTSIRCTDSDGDKVKLRIVRKPRHGDVVVRGNTMRFKADRRYRGRDSFALRPADGVSTGRALRYRVKIRR